MPRARTTKAERVALPKCGATNRQGKPCQNAAGFKTSHIGEGRCFLHGGRGQVHLPSGRYAALQARPRLQELIKQFAADDDPLNLTHELTLLRALVLDFVERYDQTTEALLNWHASFSDGYAQAVQDWRNELAEWTELKDAGEDNEPPPIPIPADFEKKPRQMVDIVAASGFIDKIGGLADRIEKRKREGVISMATLATVLEELAIELVNACEEVGIRDTARTRLLQSVDRRWRDTRSIPRDALMASNGVPDRREPPN